MKKLITVLCLLVFIIVVVTVHAVSIQKLYGDIQEITDEIEQSVSRQDWKVAEEGLQRAADRWEKSKIWAALTLTQTL